MDVTPEALKDARLRDGDRRGHLQWAAVFAGVLMAAGVVAWWWTHPKAFDDLGDSFSAEPLPLAEAALTTTVVFPKAGGSEETLTIHELDARLSSNTAEAEATFWICHMSAGEDPIGTVHDPDQTCGNYQELKPPMRFTHGIAPDSDYLFVTLTPTRRGKARLESVVVEYQRPGDHFFQRGAQTIRVDREITVP